ncbi:uncharacterized protein LOC123878815 [Maniola jurtina]|uniref:uncharacterized protein LOC123878815 n=1 Tax=Maniola jurtina TaxID=191418 RepID=UPI001E687DC2|nr:uncharacterized protein LOC123878815 [Maniola jurtina]
MDEWDSIIQTCQDESDPKIFCKVLRSAEIVLAEDLAPFETEWILSTLLHKPVHLLEVVANRRTDSSWDVFVRGALKLLGDIVTKHECADKYYDQIVQLCLLHYEPLIKQQALSCISKVARQSPAGARDFARHVSALQETTTCKAPLAVLVGTICEHHPSVVADDITTIWRVYLNLLDSNKYTVTVTKAVLEGICGLFKHFGMELPTMELNVFYDKLVNYLDLPRCEEVTLKFFQNYAHLFRERISSDKRVRTLVCNCNSVCARPAILAIYGVVFDTISDVDHIQKILETEIYPRTKSSRFYERFTALRVLTDAHTHNIVSDLSEYVDLQALESHLRNGNVDYETCEAISWSVQSKVPFSDRLLQSAILFYDRFPANKRKDVVVYPLLQADSELRTEITNFLIAESIHPATKEQCMKIWQDLFDTKNNTDNIVLENSIYIAQDVIEYATRIVEMFLEGDELTLPEAMPQLLSLLVTVLRLNSASDLPCSRLARVLRRCANIHSEVIPAAILCGLFSGEVYEDISLDICSDEDMLVECALALLGMPDDVTSKCLPRDMITALEIIFSSNNIESSTLSKAVQQLDKLLQQNRESDDKCLQVIQKVVKLSQQIDKKSKDDRILYRDIVMFLGKYGKQYDYEDQISNSDNLLIYKLKSTLILDIPHDDGMLKINLQGILHSAIKQEDPSALTMLLTIISANLVTRNDPILQAALVRVVLSLSHCDINSDVVYTAISLCDGSCANDLIGYIAVEKSHRSRKLLLEGIEVLLKDDGQILENILEHIVPNENDLQNQSQIDITEFLLKHLKDNNSLCQNYLPKIISKILNAQSRHHNIIKVASDLFVDKIELYTTNDVNDIIKSVFQTINSPKNKNMTNIEMAVEFVKRIFEIKNDDVKTENILDLFLEIFAKDEKKVNLRVFMAVTKIFEVDKERIEKVFLENNFMEKILNGRYYLSEVEHDYFDTETQLDLYIEYFDLIWKIDHGQLLSNLLSELTPQNVIKFDRKLSKCLSLVEPKYLNRMTDWFERQPVKEITQSIEKYLFESKHEVFVQVLKIMVNIYKGKEMAVPISMEFSRCIKRWVDWVAKLNASGYIERNLKSKMAFLMDLVEVSIAFLSDEELMAVLNEGESEKLKFLQDFMPAVYTRLVKKPYLLLQPNMVNCCTILNDVVRHAVRQNRKEEVLELVDLVWPNYEPLSTMNQKHSLLLDLSSITPNLPPHANVMRWLMKTVCCEDTKLAHKIRLFGILPAADEYRAAYKVLCPHLPSRLSELYALSSCCFQAVLDCLADSRDTDCDNRVAEKRVILLDIVITLAASDNTKGWWDDAIDACMSSIAASADARLSRVCSAVYARCFEGRSLGVCTRLMLPLLRYSTPSFCEEFFSKVLEELLSILKTKPREATAHYSYEKCVLDYVRALYVLQVVFQKVPKEHIESPRSLLYSKKVGDTRAYAVSTVCKLCVTLRASVKCPPAADESMKESCRLFYCSNYNCLAAAICCTQLKPAVCATVFHKDVWNHLIGDEEIKLPLRPQWIQRSTRQAVSIEVTGSLLSLRTSATLTTVRTPAFLRTLSENPFQYDLVQEDEQPQTQDLQLIDNYLNKHECAGTLTALLSRVSALEHVQWRDALIATLDGDARGNVKWLLAQAVCNSKEDLKPHASALRPALLAVIVKTAKDKKLNGLHIDILDTLIFWNEGIQPCADLNSTIECIISTAIDYRLNKNLYYMILEKLTKMLDRCVQVNWSCFDRYLTDLKSDTATCCIDILKRLAKCNVYIPELLPALTETIENKRSMSELTTLFALALTAARDRGENDGEWLRRYRSVLDRLRRSDHAEYIKLLHAAQKVFPGCCDETHFRSITDLTPKITGRPKVQCLEILSTYVVDAKRNEYVTTMFDTIGLLDIINTKEALVLAKNGLHLMEEHLRGCIVCHVASNCQQLPAKVRSEAYGVLVKAFELLLSPKTHEPAAKRRARESNSLLLSPNDTYTEIVCTAVAQGLVERDSDISKHVREGVGRCLSTDSGVRFCESFLLAIVLPLKNTSNYPESSNLAAMLDLFFRRIRDQEKFQNAKLRDEPIEPRQIISTTSSTKIMTLGTHLRNKQESSTVSLDVQMSLDNLLKSLLQYLEKNPSAATSIIVQLIKTYKTKRPGFDFDSTMSGNVSKCLTILCSMTPWILEMAREIDIWDSSNLDQIIDNLVQNTKNTEGEGICKVLLEDYRIRCYGPELFLMGNGIPDSDVDMSEASPIFSLEDLMSCFGKLSNWDDLTTQGRRSFKSTLPAMWTSRSNFDACIQDYDFTGCPAWVNAMVSTYRNSERTTRFTELDKWPRKAFDISALVECTAWDRIRDSFDIKEHVLPDYIHPSDCLAEWAFRIMLRSSYLPSLNDNSNEEIDKLSRSHELLWCVSANERGLHTQALECCKHLSELYESETLKWLHQKVVALRAVAVEKNDRDGLKKALNFAEIYPEKFMDKSSFEDVLGMSEVTLRLKRDLQSLKHKDVDKLRNEISRKLNDGEIVPGNVLKSTKSTMESICVIALTYYNGLWDSCTGAKEQSDLLLHMSEILDLFAKLDLGWKGRLLADMVLDRVNDVSVSLNSELSGKLLNAFKLLRHQLDEVSISQLTSNKLKFPHHQDDIKALTHETEMGKYRQCLSLLAGPEYLLLQYCRALRSALEKDDDRQFSRVFTNMTSAILDNPYAGPDYQVLFKYKKTLNDLIEEDISKESKRQILSSIQSELKDTRKDILYLSHLCPALTHELERDDNMSKLLCLKRGVYVAKFEEKISVFVDSIRRPTLVRCRLSDGSVARCIVKCGERSRPHCAAMRLLAAVQPRTDGRVRAGYYVTPLSEDCGLIQYLEDHERFKALIKTTCDVDGLVSTIRRSNDSELILSPNNSLQTFEQLCAKIPAYLLRSAIEATCVTLQDFIVKKKNFLESLCDMTVLSYLYGIGDRHLENMMYSIQDGGACHVDAGAILQYGGMELPPARLTRNILAVCDFTVIESRLQTALSHVRDSRELLVPAITVSFKWMGDSEFMDKLPHIKNLINGSTLSYKVTIEVVSASNNKYKDKYIQLLEEVFADFDEKETYSVEEQVSSLLRQSTEPRLLSVTRTGWEPWI